MFYSSPREYVFFRYVLGAAFDRLLHSSWQPVWKWSIFTSRKCYIDVDVTAWYITIIGAIPSRFDDTLNAGTSLSRRVVINFNRRGIMEKGTVISHCTLQSSFRVIHIFGEKEENILSASIIFSRILPSPIFLHTICHKRNQLCI